MPVEHLRRSIKDRIANFLNEYTDRMLEIRAARIIVCFFDITGIFLIILGSKIPGVLYLLFFLISLGLLTRRKLLKKVF